MEDSNFYNNVDNNHEELFIACCTGIFFFYKVFV